MKLMKYTQNKLKGEISFPELISICPLKFEKSCDKKD